MNSLSVLLIYFGLLAFALLWCRSLHKKALRSFDPPPGVSPNLSSPIEIAYLAGGAQRCSETAIASLIQKKAITWQKPDGQDKGRLIAVTELPPDSHWLEKSFHSAISTRGTVGLPLSSLGPTMLNGIRPLESHLAKLGLRPTREEFRSKQKQLLMPLLILLLLGVLVLIYNHLDHAPTAIFLLPITANVFAIWKTYDGFGKLSRVGTKLLSGLKEAHRDPDDNNLVTIALFGIASMGADLQTPEVDSSMLEEFDHLTRGTTGRSGCGGTVIYGGSSDGASGCGGCGGGGCGGGGCGGGGS